MRPFGTMILPAPRCLKTVIEKGFDQILLCEYIRLNVLKMFDGQRHLAGNSDKHQLVISRPVKHLARIAIHEADVLIADNERKWQQRFILDVLERVKGRAFLRS